MIFIRIKNWVIEKRGWILIVLLVGIIVTASFTLGYFLGKSANKNPIIINTQNISQ